MQEGGTPLMAACQQGHLSVVQLLCERGANLHAKTKVRSLAWWRGTMVLHQQVHTLSVPSSQL